MYEKHITKASTQAMHEIKSLPLVIILFKLYSIFMQDGFSGYKLRLSH